MTSRPEPRIHGVTAESMTADQRTAAEALLAGPRQGLRGPFTVLLNSPGVFGPAQALGSYLRFESSLPANLRELAVLVTAHHWRQDYEWRVHSEIARDNGIRDTVIEAIASGQEPIELLPREDIVYQFCRQLHQFKFVDDATYDRAEKLLGPLGVIDLSALCGYYAMLAMIMNVARNPLPDASSPFQG